MGDFKFIASPKPKFPINTLRNSIHGDEKMAQLNSPGVDVSIINESFYTPSAPGTIPLVVVATAENKENGAGTGTALGTLKSNAGQVYLLSSQKDLTDTFGTPIFKTDAYNNPIHAGEQNEYGLQAAYSFLGVSNRAYVVRADVDLAQLEAASEAPKGDPTNGTFWLDTANTNFGIFEWNSTVATVTGGQTFTHKTPTVITDATQVINFENGDYTPRPSIGSIGDYAIVSVTTLKKLWYKKPDTGSQIYLAGTWVEVGSPAWKASRPAAIGTVQNPTIQGTAHFIIAAPSMTTQNITNQTTITGLTNAINNNSVLTNAGITAANINGYLYIYSSGSSFTLSGDATTSVGLVLNSAYLAPALQISAHTSVPLFKRSDLPSSPTGRPTGSIWVKTTTPNSGAMWSIKKFNSATMAWDAQLAPLYANNQAALAALDPSGGGRNLPVGTVYVKYNDDEGATPMSNFKVYARKSSGATTIKSKVIGVGTFTDISHTNTFTITDDINATPRNVHFTATNSANDLSAFLTALTSALDGTNITASKDPSSNAIIISNVKGGDIRFADGVGTPIASLFDSTTTNFYLDPSNPGPFGGNDDTGLYMASLWTSSFDLPASAVAPSTDPEDGTLWYSGLVFDVDVMVNNGTTWKGYRNIDLGGGFGLTDANGPIVSSTKPLTQSDGISSLVNGDLWVDISDLENYPLLYKYDAVLARWILVDNNDQTTENGIIFHDARWGTTGGTTSEAPTGSITELLVTDYVDPDAPNPALYPKGMLLWNLRRSGFNVKQFETNFIDTTNVEYADYYPHRWVSVAANQEQGAGTFGRKAQRQVIIQSLQATFNTNQAIRDEESKLFNLIACPGYPELIGEMVNLNVDRGLTAFVIGDTPARLTPDTTTLSNWGTNAANALQDGESGLVTYDDYLGVFYPWGYTSDNLGNNIVVPPSHMMLKTFALSDNVSYPWFAPAGTRRGIVTNVTAVGYVNSTTGEFQSVSLNTGQRDTLQQTCKINPITFISGTGLVNYGQKTRSSSASALDRINVSRLVVYLRRRFALLAKPFLFEPNDKITRDELKGAADNLLLELVGQRALYDFITVCDTTNNTPARIDRNELYLDVAVEPVKAVEFIYIPLRLQNTGTIKALAGQ